MTLRIGWFSTGAGPGSQRWRMFNAVIDAIGSGQLDAEIAFVFCNRERGEDAGTDAFLDLAESHGVPTIVLSSRRSRRERGGELSKPGQPLPQWRGVYDRAVAELIAPYQFDVGMLAGYMLIFTPEMSRRYPFLNLHPAAPGGPVGTWQEVIHQLIETRAERSGVMVHVATEELDRGPVVAYCTFSLRGGAFDRRWGDIDPRSISGEDNPLFLEIRRHAAAREVPLVVATLRALAERRVMLDGDGVVDGAGRRLAGGLDLTIAVDASVAAELDPS
jgi:folate-dependent phosphoribosylglycinamide formyltransferase PurN